MRVIRAEAMGMCFGVRDALARAAQVRAPETVAIHGELVHNRTVLDDLTGRGFTISDETHRAIPDLPTVMVTAHGISERERERLLAAGKALIDTTCPLVRRVHDAARSLETDGYFVLLVGRRGHVEVRGVAEDLRDFLVVQKPAEVGCWPHRARIGIVCQSTAAENDVTAIRAQVERLNPQAQVKLVDTVCRPTKERQAALETLCRQVEAVVVVGGRNSHNTRRLVARCTRRGVPAFHVVDETELEEEWFEGLSVVGLAAGTSTPDAVIDRVERRLCRAAAACV